MNLAAKMKSFDIWDNVGRDTREHACFDSTVNLGYRHLSILFVRL
jgi:hypothetical protein